MTRNAALAELERTADVGEAKRDLVLRFVRDQESLQTSQVELKLVDDNTIDLIDSAFAVNEIASQQYSGEISSTRNDEELVRTGISEMALDDENQGVSGEMAQGPRPPSGRPPSRRAHRKTNSELKEKRKISSSRRIQEVDRFSSNSPMSPLPADNGGSYKDCTYVQPDLDSNAALNSSWPQQVLSRKSSIGTNYRKYALYTPDKHLVFEATDFENTAYPQDSRPVSSRSFQRLATGEAVIAARVRKHSANERITCDINSMIDSRSATPARSSARSSSRRSTSRGRTLINLGLEPVYPSEIPLLRAASAGKASISGPYTLVQLPPISRETPAATPPSS